MNQIANFKLPLFLAGVIKSTLEFTIDYCGNENVTKALEPVLNQVNKIIEPL